MTTMPSLRQPATSSPNGRARPATACGDGTGPWWDSRPRNRRRSGRPRRCGCAGSNRARTRGSNLPGSSSTSVSCAQRIGRSTQLGELAAGSRAATAATSSNVAIAPAAAQDSRKLLREISQRMAREPLSDPVEVVSSRRRRSFAGSGARQNHDVTEDGHSRGGPPHPDAST